LVGIDREPAIKQLWCKHALNEIFFQCY
jgi:hypothetical protein